MKISETISSKSETRIKSDKKTSISATYFFLGEQIFRRRVVWLAVTRQGKFGGRDVMLVPFAEVWLVVFLPELVELGRVVFLFFLLLPAWLHPAHFDSMYVLAYLVTHKS